MATREEGKNVNFSSLAIASVTFGALGLAIGLLALRRSQAEAAGYAPLGVDIPKVRYDHGEVLVQVRKPGEWYDIREFVQPYNPAPTSIINGAFYG